MRMRKPAMSSSMSSDGLNVPDTTLCIEVRSIRSLDFANRLFFVDVDGAHFSLWSLANGIVCLRLTD